RVPDQERRAEGTGGRGIACRAQARARRVPAREARPQRARRSPRQRSTGRRMIPSHHFGCAVAAGDEEAALATLADDVVFRSPAAHKPYQGREQVDQLLRLVATVFENFRYTNEWRDGRTTILFFEANVGDRELQGIDILEENGDGLVEKLTVMVRPLSGLQALAGTIAARLGAA